MFIVTTIHDTYFILFYIIILLFNFKLIFFIAVPLILSEILAVNDQQLATDTLTLRYTPTPQTASRFIKYRFQLAEAHQQTQSTVTTLDSGPGVSTSNAPTILIAEKWASDNEWKVTWHSLVPGRLYDITVWTVSAYNVLSQPLRRQDRLC